MDAHPQLLALVLILHLVWFCRATAASASSSAAHHLEKGFSAVHDASYSQFQPLLADPTGVFYLGFLRVDANGLDLAVLHLPSSFPLWRALPGRPLDWEGSASVSFNGSLVLSDDKTGEIWSTHTDDGDRIVLLNSSDLQVQKLAGEFTTVLWKSFDFPSDTLVQGQNLKSSSALFSDNQRFSMRFGASYIALHMELGRRARPMYWKHTTMDGESQAVEGPLTVYAQVDAHGFLGIYYKNATTPADVLYFDSFNRGVRGLRRLTLESEGNLLAYYWNSSAWFTDYKAITEHCALPTVCGAYGLCSLTGEPQCLCLEEENAGACPPSAGSDDYCGAAGDRFQVLRRNGVDLANKELMAFDVKVESLEECERSCEQNCSCFGTIYNNASGYCYLLDYPIQSLVEGDVSTVAYFKVGNRDSRALESGEDGGRKLGAALLAVGCGILAGAAVYGTYRLWKQKGGRFEGSITKGLSPGPYRDLKSDSFRSVELSGPVEK